MTILVSKLKMVEYLSRCDCIGRRCECELVRGCGQSWLVVGEEWLKESERMILPRVI